MGLARFRQAHAVQGLTPMRPTSFLALLGLIVIGVIVADFLIHPEGTKAAAQGLVALEKPTMNALLGSTTK